MEAVVTIKVSPQEFDILRMALDSLNAEANRLAQDSTGGERQKHRQIAFQAHELLQKVRG